MIAPANQATVNTSANLNQFDDDVIVSSSDERLSQEKIDARMRLLTRCHQKKLKSWQTKRYNRNYGDLTLVLTFGMKVFLPIMAKILTPIDLSNEDSFNLKHSYKSAKQIARTKLTALIAPKLTSPRQSPKQLGCDPALFLRGW